MLEPEELIGRLTLYANMEGKLLVNKPDSVECAMPSGARLTVWREAEWRSTQKGIKLFLGQIYFPYHKYARNKLLGEPQARYLYDILGERIKIMKVLQKHAIN